MGPCWFALSGLPSSDELAWISTVCLNKALCVGKKPVCGEEACVREEACVWLRYPRRFRCVPFSNICCCGKQAGQSAHSALASCRSRGSRPREGCKQHQEQQSAAWAWHFKWGNFAGATPYFCLSHRSNPRHQLSSMHTYAKSNTNARA